MEVEPSDTRRQRPKYSAKIGQKRGFPSPPSAKSWSSPKSKAVSSPKRSKIHSGPKIGAKAKTKLAAQLATAQNTAMPQAKTTPGSVTPVRERVSVKRQVRVSPRTLQKQSSSSRHSPKVLTPLQKSSSQNASQPVKKNVKMAATATTTPLTIGRRRSIQAHTPGQSTSLTHTPAPTTPYRTPRRMSLDQTPAPDMKDAEKRFHENAAEWREELKGLLNKSMKVSNLSSMNNFFYQRKIYRTKYEKELKNKIHQSYPLPVLNVSLVTSSCLRYHPGRVDAVKITVTSVVYGDTLESDRIATIYVAWLLHSNHVQTSKFNSVWFPIMLYSGREKVHSAVTDWLQGAFGCYIAKSGIRRWDLLWMIGVWSGRSCPNPSHSKDGEYQVSLTYHIRPPVGQPRFSTQNARGKPRLVMRLPLKEIHHIWETIVVSSKDEINLTQLRQFFFCMDRLAAEFLKLPISYLSIITFATPCMSLSADGKVRLTCRRGAWYVLNHLSQIFIKSTTSSVFREYFRNPLQDGEEDRRGDEEEEDENEDEDEEEEEEDQE